MVPVALDEVMEAMAGVNIVASDPVKDAADHLLEALAEVISVASQHRARRTRGSWSAYEEQALVEPLDSFVRARLEFERSAHDELGVH